MRAGRISWLAALAALLTALMAASCMTGNSDPGKEASCAELGSKYFLDSSDQGHYRIVSPNGGESFKVGDTVKVVVASGVSDSEALIQLAVTVKGSLRIVALPGLANHSINTRTQCRMDFVIPDSVESGFGSRFSLVSDSVRIRIAWYNHDTYRDYSDGYFRIAE